MIITVYRNDEEMQANKDPDGLAILARYGWTTEKPRRVGNTPKKSKKVSNDNSD